MKKILSVFITILLVSCALFAKGEIKVQSLVKGYTLDQANTDSAGGLYRLCVNGGDSAAEASNYILVDADISRENVIVDFMIKQQQTTMTNEAITISVEAGQLSYKDYASNEVYSTTEFFFTAIGDPSVSEDYLEVDSETPEDNTLILSLRYKNSSLAVARGTTIATFTANWERNAELVEHPGTYSADLTLKYVVN